MNYGLDLLNGGIYFSVEPISRILMPLCLLVLAVLVKFIDSFMLQLLNRSDEAFDSLLP